MTREEKDCLVKEALRLGISCHVQKHGSRGFQVRFSGDAWHRKESNARAAFRREIPSAYKSNFNEVLGLGA